MSRRTGQVTALQAVAAVLVGGLALAVLVAGLDVLIRADQDVAAVGEPARPEAACPDASRPQPDDPMEVTSAELTACPGAYDGRAVRLEGEVVRAVLERGDRAWVQLNDDAYALGPGPLPEHRVALGANTGTAVSLPAVDAGGIETVGSHRARGDVLEIVGVFRRADPDDAGGPTVTADAVEVVRRGAPITHDVDPARVVAAALAMLAAAAAALAAQRARRR